MNQESRIKKILTIDTSSNEEVVIGLRIDGKEHKKKRKIEPRQSHVVLPMIEALLASCALHLVDLTAIEVKADKGSYTGLRLGVSIANTLGWSLNIPVNGKLVGEIVTPDYS